MKSDINNGSMREIVIIEVTIGSAVLHHSHQMARELH